MFWKLSAVLLVGAVPLLAPSDPQPVTSNSPGFAEAWKIDPGHSSAIFRVQHLKAAPFYGRFNSISGSFSLGEGDGAMVEVEIATDSVDSGNVQRDKHLKNTDFFSAKEFPKLTFKSKSMKKVGADEYEVVGDLTLRGKTREIQVMAQHTGTAEVHPRFGKRTGVETTFTIDRSDFGIDYGLEGDVLGDEVRITIALEGMK